MESVGEGKLMNSDAVQELVEAAVQMCELVSVGSTCDRLRAAVEAVEEEEGK